ncbi:acyl-CoA N-acyltransferase [Mycena vitilis]|nr:acyl-CoA N-acyltransferase [Mycena vitilis]
MANSNINWNFCFPIPGEMKNERVKLVPFDHSDAFVAGADETMFTYVAITKASDLISLVIDKHRATSDPGTAFFAVLDLASGEVAGLVNLHKTSPASLSAEIGIMTLPRFQRTHVTSNAAGLLLHWVLDAPAEGGLGLRRIVWTTNALNAVSVKTAERMGFRKEGVLRWHRTVPAAKAEVGNGIALREGDPKPERVGGDTMILGLCWDDWEGGTRAAVDTVMQRTA